MCSKSGYNFSAFGRDMAHLNQARLLSIELVHSVSKRFDRCWHEAGLESDFVLPPMVKVIV